MTRDLSDYPETPICEIEPVQERLTAGEILARAVAYPYSAPLRSFVQVGREARELPAQGFDLAGREPLLSYGANASPAVLARKLASLPDLPLPVLRAELDDFDVVYSAHISPYGAVPSTLQRSPGTAAPVFFAFPTAEQLELLSATEPNYELRRLDGLRAGTEPGQEIGEANAFLSRHGCLVLDDSEALAAIEAIDRRFPALGEVEVLERVRHVLAPELDLERFVASSLDPGLAAARTAVLHGNARPTRLQEG
jgi:hypothetical protein